MITEIISYNDHTFGSNYTVNFVPGSEPRLPPAQVQTLTRIGAWPVITALQGQRQTHALIVRIEGTNRNTLRTQLFQWFDNAKGQVVELVGETHAGVEVFLDVLCEEFRVYGDQAHDVVFVATVVVDGDVRWRATTETTESWSITASGQTHVFNNTSEDEVYPTITIEPTSSKSSNTYDYARPVLVTWRAINAGSAYPVRLGPLDTASLVTAGKMQADGDDLRIFVDGEEVYRYLVDMNDANTYIWFSTDWLEAPEITLSASIAGAGTVVAIELNDVDEMNKLPSSGFVRIDDEIFYYDAKDPQGVQLTGIERALWGTSAGAHSAGEDVWWMQHRIDLVYGDASASDPPDDTPQQPIMTLANSDNTEWVYNYFGDEGQKNNRPGKWFPRGYITLEGRNSGVYTATEKTLAAPFEVAGAWNTESGHVSGVIGWYLYNPCGIVNAAWASGKKRAADSGIMNAQLRYFVREDSWYSTQKIIANPSSVDTWESWSEAAAASDWDPADYIDIMIYFWPQDIEVGQVTVSLNSDETPVTSIGSETGNYTLAATLTNQTEDQALTIDFEMALNEELEIDTQQKIVTYNADGSNQINAVSRDSARTRWLPLSTGNNTLKFVDAGTAGVTLTVTYRGRYYD